MKEQTIRRIGGNIWRNTVGGCVQTFRTSWFIPFDKKPPKFHQVDKALPRKSESRSQKAPHAWSPPGARMSPVPIATSCSGFIAHPTQGHRGTIVRGLHGCFEQRSKIVQNTKRRVFQGKRNLFECNTKKQASRDSNICCDAPHATWRIWRLGQS